MTKIYLRLSEVPGFELAGGNGRGGLAHLGEFEAQEVRAGQPVVITIARDNGAEGHEIGKMLSKE